MKHFEIEYFENEQWIRHTDNFGVHKYPIEFKTLEEAHENLQLWTEINMQVRILEFNTEIKVVQNTNINPT